MKATSKIEITSVQLQPDKISKLWISICCNNLKQSLKYHSSYFHAATDCIRGRTILTWTTWDHEQVGPSKRGSLATTSVGLADDLQLIYRRTFPMPRHLVELLGLAHWWNSLMPSRALRPSMDHRARSPFAWQNTPKMQTLRLSYHINK